MTISRHTRPTLVASAIALCIASLVAASQAGAQAIRVPRSVLEQYVGEYAYPEGNTISITLSGDTLFREIPGQRVALEPLSNTRFRMGGVFTAEFVLDDAGGATQLLSDGVDVEFRLNRRRTGGAAVVTSAAPAARRVPRAVLERYVGTYDYIPGQMGRTDLFVLVALRGDTLIRSMGGRNVSVLTPISETQFRVGNTSMLVEFVVDDAGVTQVMGSGFQQLLARRRK